MLRDLLDLLQETDEDCSMKLYTKIVNEPAFMLGNSCVEATYNAMREMVLAVASTHDLEQPIEFDELPCIHQLDDAIAESPMAYVVGKRSIQKITRNARLIETRSRDEMHSRNEKYVRTFHRCLRELVKQREYRRFIELLRRWHVHGHSLQACTADDLVKVIAFNADPNDHHEYAQSDYSVCVDMMHGILAYQTPSGIYAEFEKCFGEDCARDLMRGFAPGIPSELAVAQKSLLHKILREGGGSGIPVDTLSFFKKASGYEGGDSDEKDWLADQRRAGIISPHEPCAKH